MTEGTVAGIAHHHPFISMRLAQTMCRWLHTDTQAQGFLAQPTQ